jgi:hypothetical protein
MGVEALCLDGNFHMKKFVLGVAALAITAGGASAADMAVKAPRL